MLTRRTTLALAVLHDLAARWPDQCTFFSSYEGLGLAPSHFSIGLLHRVLPSCAGATAILLGHCCFAVLLMGDVFPRCAALGCFVCSLSRLQFSPDTAHGGDHLLCTACLWVSLMPLRRRADDEDDEAAEGLAVLGFKMQLPIAYLAAALIKVGIDDDGARSPWLIGEAVQQALACCEYQTPLGAWLLRCPRLCTALTFGTVAIELLAPFGLLGLGGPRLQLLSVVAATGMHVGMGLAMELDGFSLVCLALLAPVASEAIGNLRCAASPAPRSIVAAPGAAAERPRARARAERFVAAGRTAVAAAALTLTAVHAVHDVAIGLHLLPDPNTSPAAALGAWVAEAAATALGVPGYSIFSLPPRICGWSVLPAVLAADGGGGGGGAQVDAHRLRHARGRGDNELPRVSFARPAWPARQHHSKLWRAIYERLSGVVPLDGSKPVEKAHLFEGLLRYHCMSSPRLARMRVVFMAETYDAQGRVAQRSRHDILDEDCSVWWRNERGARTDGDRVEYSYTSPPMSTGRGTGSGTMAEARPAVEPVRVAVDEGGGAQVVQSRLRPEESRGRGGTA